MMALKFLLFGVIICPIGWSDIHKQLMFSDQSDTIQSQL